MKYSKLLDKIKNDYKLSIFLFILLVCLIAFVSIRSNFCFHFTENTGYYFFSSLLQANAAIFSIFGVFFIYRLQTLNSSISEIFNSLIMTAGSSIGREEAQKFKNLTLEDKEKNLIKYKDSNHVWSHEFINWYNYEKKIEIIKPLIKKPTIILITLIIFQAAFVLLSSDIHSIGLILEITTFIINLFCEAYILIILGQTIFQIID